jgi:hypothetical protein
MQALYLSCRVRSTMDINALVIHGSDQGAVPCVSTNHSRAKLSFEASNGAYGDEIGSTDV